MEKHRIKRLPVTAGGPIVGVVSRADLLRALVSRVRHAEPLNTDDRSIRTAIMNALEAQPWAPTTTLNVTVSDRVVDLWGTIATEEERHGIRVIAENTGGVHAVNDHMVYIDPIACILCQACVPVCPEQAIYDEADLPAEFSHWIEINAERASSLPLIDEKQTPLKIGA